MKAIDCGECFSSALSAKLAQMFYENDLAYSRKVTAQDANEFNDPSDALYKLEKEFGTVNHSIWMEMNRQ